MKTLTITLTDDNSIKTEASESMGLEEVMDITLSAILGIMNEIKSNAEEHTDKHEELEAFLFGMFNEAASTLLAQFAPTLDLRPDISADAIMELEDKQLKGQLDLLKQEE